MDGQRGMAFGFWKAMEDVMIQEIYIHRASQILIAATDGCRSQPWLACWLASGHHTEVAPKHSLLFQLTFRVIDHAHHVHLQSRDVSVY